MKQLHHACNKSYTGLNTTSESSRRSSTEVIYGGCDQDYESGVREDLQQAGKAEMCSSLRESRASAEGENFASVFDISPTLTSQASC